MPILDNTKIDDTIQLDAETAKAKLEDEVNPPSFHDELQQKINEIHLSISKQDIIQLQQEGLQITHRSNDRRNVQHLQRVKLNGNTTTVTNQTTLQEPNNQDDTANQTTSKHNQSK